MVQQIILSKAEFLTLIGGWIVAVIAGLLVVFIKMWTPGFTFLKAKLKKQQIVWAKDKSGIGRFLLGKITTPGTIDIKDIGPVMITEGSQVLDDNSKTMIFEVFAEYGTTTPREYSAIVQELREKGWTINTYQDYQHILKLVNDAEYRSEYLANLMEKDREEMKERIEQLRREGVKLIPWKTYNTHTLQYMFPNNINPIYVQVKADALAQIKARRDKLKSALLISVGIAALLIFLGAAIAWRMVNSGTVATVAHAVSNIPG